MFSLQKLLGKDDQFFELLERSANEVHVCATVLHRIIREPDATATLNELRQSRQRNKRYTEEISELVVRTFVTALEREDIEALAGAIYKIPKPMEKFAERLLVSRSIVSDIDFTKQGDLLEGAAENVVKMVQALRRRSHLEEIRALNTLLHQAEANADTLEIDLLEDLYAKNRNDFLKVILVKDLYDLLEKVVDRCRDAGNVVTHIVLKNS